MFLKIVVSRILQKCSYMNPTLSVTTIIIVTTIVFQFGLAGWFTGYSLGCQPVDYSLSVKAMRVRYLLCTLSLEQVSAIILTDLQPSIMLINWSKITI